MNVKVKKNNTTLPADTAKVKAVMRKYKKKKLHSGKSKRIVTNRKQAVAIALSEGRKQTKKKKNKK